jgi:dienelactone hydrolase
MDYRRWTALLAVAVAATVPGAALGAAPPTWTGTFRLPQPAEPVRIGVDPAHGLVVLGAGHAPETRVRVRLAGGRLRFSLPGRPAPLVFDGRTPGARIAGTVRQGGARGAFTLARGSLPPDRALGAYRLAAGGTLGVFGADGPRVGVAFESGAVHGLFGSGPSFTVGSGILTRGTPVGSARFGDTATWLGEAATRLPMRYAEVRFGSLAGTLWLPATPGRHAAVALAHGSGATSRATAGALAPYFASRGLVVLAYDKRGVGQSGGAFPGEPATPANVDVYARDAAAAVRFLAAQPEVDPAGVGLAGQSQAGWVMALAAAREPAVRWVVSWSGPSVSVGESDLWGHLAGQGGEPAEPLDRAEQDVRRLGVTGFDPLPSLRKLRIPLLYLYGGNDRHVPTKLCVERLAPLADDRARDVTVALLPSGDHFLLDTAHGLAAETAAASRYAEGLWSTLDSWLAAHDLRG